MRKFILAALASLLVCSPEAAVAQGASRTLVVVLAHADDETAVGPILARYSGEGVQVHMIVVTDGGRGVAATSIPEGPELARARAAEARCAAQALGVHPPILLGYPDGKLGDHATDPGLLYRLTAELAEELQRLEPDALITWGPDGGTGHTDHRLVSNLVTQLVRAGAPGLPERLYYMSVPAEGFRALNPQLGEPPLLIPAAEHFTVRISFSPENVAAARRAIACHRSQFPDDVVQRLARALPDAWAAGIPLVPAFSTGPRTDLF